jgi:hypothetical protein
MARPNRSEQAIKALTESARFAGLLGVAALGAAVTLSAPPLTPWRVFMSIIAIIVGAGMLISSGVFLFLVFNGVRMLDDT